MSEPKPVVLFGAGPIAQFVHFLFVNDSPFDVVAVALDRDHISDREAFGLPVVPFDDMLRRYPPERYSMFIALGYRQVNKVREERCRAAREMGYDLVTYVSSRASTWPSLEIGDNSLVMDEVIIHPFTVIGRNVILWSGSHIGHHTVVGDNCFLASRAIASGFVTLEDNCILGSNSTIRDGLTVARDSVVGAGAVITQDTEPGGIYAAPAPRVLPGKSDRLPRL